MATDIFCVMERRVSKLREYMETRDIVQAKVVALYYNAADGMHVLWHTGVVGADATGPKVAHTVVANGKIVGTNVPVFVQISHVAALKRLQIWYRTQGAGAYLGPFEFDMMGDGVTYRASIPTNVVINPAVEYYIEAEDSNANTTSVGDAGAPNTFTVP